MMLVAFGFSWPFAIARTYPQFMFIVIFGYLCGIAAHLAEGLDDPKLWLVAVYAIDIALVSTDLALYFRYSRRNSR